MQHVATPLWSEVWECNSHSQKWENGVLRDSRKFRRQFEGSNRSPWCVFYINEKVLKLRWPKWPRMGHLDIYSLSYGQKKGRESNCQFDSRPLKVGNRPLPDVASRSVTRSWKDLDESYNFGSNLVPIRLQGKELWTSKVPGLQPGIVSGFQLGSPTIKPFKDLPPLLCPWWGKDYIRWCHLGCLWKMQNYCPKGANPRFSTAFFSIFSSTCRHCSINGCTLVDVVIVNPTWIDLVSRTTFCCGVATIVAIQVSEGRPLSWLLPNGHVYSSCHRSFWVFKERIIWM
jgi:hypothetical protein